jgi:hypothetical protein
VGGDQREKSLRDPRLVADQIERAIGGTKLRLIFNALNHYMSNTKGMNIKKVDVAFQKNKGRVHMAKAHKSIDESIHFNSERTKNKKTSQGGANATPFREIAYIHAHPLSFPHFPPRYHDTAVRATR